MSHLLRRPSILFLGLLANLLVPVAYIVGVAQMMRFWHDPDETRSLLVGLALIGSMPIAGSATAWSRKTYGKDFDRLAPSDRVAALKAMEDGKAAFENFDAKAFFGQLHGITMAGFFADPIYGGNRDKIGWKLLGFPGLPATYADKIDAYRDKRYVAEPQSIADFS